MRHGEHIRVLAIDDIYWIRADGNYLHIYVGPVRWLCSATRVKARADADTATVDFTGNAAGILATHQYRRIDEFKSTEPWCAARPAPYWASVLTTAPWSAASWWVVFA